MKSDKANLIKVFIGGSLLIMLVGLSSAAILFAYSFLNKEEGRAAISRQQLAHFFEFNRVAMSEDMSTDSYDSIRNRVAMIASQMGDADYQLVLIGPEGQCIRTETSKVKQACAIPQSLNAMRNSFMRTQSPDAVVQFENSTQRYVYMTPLLIGEFLKGFLFVSLSDPYEFYRGGIWSIIVRTLLPALTFILILWFLWLFASRKFFIRPYIEGLAEMKQKEHFAQTARSTVHDFREPLTQLSDCIKKLSTLSEDERTFITGTILELEDIAHGLLDHSRIWSGKDRAAELRPEHLESLIQRMVGKKRSQFGLRNKLSIQFNPTPATFGVFAEIHANDFRRVFSNLIRNSVEAMNKPSGLIALTLSANDALVTIEVIDNGKGIPAEVMPRLFQPDATFGKRNGNGLGLSYSKQVLESWGGSIELTSTEGKGTKATVTLKRTPTPEWFPTQIQVQEDTKIIVVDDNPPAHERWALRFGEFALQHHVHHLSGESDLVKWHSSTQGSCLYLVDYELGSNSRNGLDLIDDLELYESAILVTHHFEDEEIRRACARLGVRLMPKDFIDQIPLSVERPRTESVIGRAFRAVPIVGGPS